MSDITSFSKMKPVLNRDRDPILPVMKPDTPIKITGFLKHSGKVVKLLLLPGKNGKDWQYVNLTKKHICPCKFETKEKALEDFEKNYAKKYDLVSREIL